MLNDLIILAHSQETENVWQETFNLITDPAHAMTEIFYSLLFDLLIIPVTIFIYRKIREPNLRKEIHQEIDQEHGINHQQCEDKKGSE